MRRGPEGLSTVIYSVTPRRSGYLLRDASKEWLSTVIYARNGACRLEGVAATRWPTLPVRLPCRLSLDKIKDDGMRRAFFEERSGEEI